MKTIAQGVLGKWLAYECDKEHLSLRRAAAKTGLSHATIRDLIHGVRPTAESIGKLAVAFGGDGERRLVLQDKLLVLAGYRTERPDAPEPNETLARLLDQLRTFDEAKLKMMTQFADFLSGMEWVYDRIAKVADSHSLVRFHYDENVHVLNEPGVTELEMVGKILQRASKMEPDMRDMICWLTLPIISRGVGRKKDGQSP